MLQHAHHLQRGSNMNQHSTAASTQRFFSAPLSETDPELAAAIQHELVRQQDGIELIASENIVSAAVLEAQGSVLTIPAGATMAAASTSMSPRIWRSTERSSFSGAVLRMCSRIPVRRPTRRFFSRCCSLATLFLG